LQTGIDTEKTVRLVVAKPLAFVSGRDAELKELAPGLHRNNAPRRLSGGRLDLRSFETCYPQVSAELPLAQKIPLQAGVDGRDILGQPLPAPAAKDFDLTAIAGPGTRVSSEKDGEYLLACRAGFLVIDTKTQQFSVSEKIVSHEGVSVRTTGDLSLNVEEYEQHGEIQEKRIVHCRSITAHGAVCGQIISSGGLVCLKSNLVGGSASNAAGDIVVEGLASGATLTAQAGAIKLKRADNCLIRAQRVTIERAVNCDIVADEVSIDLAEGCAVAGKTIQLSWARSWRELDNSVLVRLPDLAGSFARQRALQTRLSEVQQARSALQEKLSELRSEKEMASYLRLAGEIRRQERVLSPEQEAGWQRLAAKMAPALRLMAKLNGLLKQHESEIQQLDQQLAELKQENETACQGINCQIEQSEGDTRVVTYQPAAGQESLFLLSPKELKLRLRRCDEKTRCLFAGSGQRFAWNYRPPIPLSES
ncbi:MAG TPA: FapA family protein, partial [Accumulibacter sp.]|nr:FapA family protein [Accumulibacter sp.]